MAKRAPYASSSNDRSPRTSFAGETLHGLQTDSDRARSYIDSPLQQIVSIPKPPKVVLDLPSPLSVQVPLAPLLGAVAQLVVESPANWPFHCEAQVRGCSDG